MLHIYQACTITLTKYTHYIIITKFKFLLHILITLLTVLINIVIKQLKYDTILNYLTFFKRNLFRWRHLEINSVRLFRRRSWSALFMWLWKQWSLPTMATMAMWQVEIKIFFIFHCFVFWAQIWHVLFLCFSRWVKWTECQLLIYN